MGTASAANHEYLKELGATGVEYGDGLTTRALEIQPGGFDVILYYAGSDSLNDTARLLAEGGTVVSVADPRAASEFGGQYAWVDPNCADLAELAALIDEGAIKVAVAHTYALEDTKAGYAALEGSHVRGNIVVTP